MPNVSKEFINALSIFIISLIVSYISLVFWRVCATKNCNAKAGRNSVCNCDTTAFCNKNYKACFQNIYSLTTNLIIRIFGFDPNINEDSVTEEEIRMLVDVGEEKSYRKHSKEMINNILSLMMCLLQKL